MKLIKFIQFLMLAIVAGMFSNCASLAGFQDGRTTGKDNGEIVASLNMGSTPKLNDLEVEGTKTFWFPNIEVGGRYGVMEKLDVGLRINTYGNVAISGKYQFLGDRASKTAMATGLEIGVFGFGGSLLNVQVPLFFSIHPTEKFTFYVNPKYIYQFSTAAIGTDASGGIQYYGSNLGIAFGRRKKFGIDFGYYIFDASGVDEKPGMMTIGLGGRFPIGDNDVEDTKKGKAAKKKLRKIK